MQTTGHTTATAPTDGDVPALIAQLSQVTDRVLAAVAAATTDADGVIGGACDAGLGMPVIGDLVGTADRVTAAAVEVLSAVSFRGVTADEGITPGTWLRMQAGRTVADERMLANAAERLADMPVLRGWWRTGVVSWAAVRQIVAVTRNLTRAQRRWVDEMLVGNVDRITRMSADDLVGAVQRLTDHARPDLHCDRQRAAYDRRGVYAQPALDGSGRLHADLDAESFDAVLSALDSYRDTPDDAVDSSGNESRGGTGTGDGDHAGNADDSGDSHCADDEDDDDAAAVWGARGARRRGIARRRADGLRAMADHRNAGVCAANLHPADCANCQPGPGPDPDGPAGEAAADATADATTDVDDDHASDGERVDVGQARTGGMAGLIRGDTCAATGGPGSKIGWAPSKATPSITIVADISMLADNPDLVGIAQLLSSMVGPVEITRSALERNLCTAAWRVMVTDGATVLGVTATHPAVSTRLAHAVVARDVGCRFPGCPTPAATCDIHHLVRVADGGLTEIENLALLCDQHHHAVHDGGWTNTRNPDESITFTRRGVSFTSLPRSLQHLDVTTRPPPGRPHRTSRTPNSSGSGDEDVGAAGWPDITTGQSGDLLAAAGIRRKPPPRPAEPDVPVPF